MEKYKRGRKAIPKLEKKVPVKIWVKAKDYAEAKKECFKIQQKFNSIVSRGTVEI